MYSAAFWWTECQCQWQLWYVDEISLLHRYSTSNIWLVFVGFFFLLQTDLQYHTYFFDIWHASVSSNYDKVSVSRLISLLPPPMWSYPKGHGYGGQQGEGGCGLCFYSDVQLFRATASCNSFLIQQCIMLCSLFTPASSLTKNTTVLHITWRLFISGWPLSVDSVLWTNMKFAIIICAAFLSGKSKFNLISFT